MKEVQDFLTIDFVYSAPLWVYLVIGLCELCFATAAVVLVVKNHNLRKELVYSDELWESWEGDYDNLDTNFNKLTKDHNTLFAEHHELKQEHEYYVGLHDGIESKLRSEIKELRSGKRKQALQNAIFYHNNRDMKGNNFPAKDVTQTAKEFLNFYLGKS